MLTIRKWRIFARESPATATVLATIPFAFLVALAVISNSTVYNGATPGVIAGAITVLYLALTVFVGLTTPLRAGSISPVLAYVAMVMLWPLTPGEGYDSMTYDSGWVGGIIYKVVIPSGIIWLFAYAGYLIGWTENKR